MGRFFNIENLIMALIISGIITIVINGPSIFAFVCNFIGAYIGAMIGQKIGEM